MIQNMSVALQLYSVRDDMARDFRGTLEKVKAMGYEGVEFAGLFGQEPTAVRAMLDEVGLAGISAHVPFDELTGDVEKTVSDYQAIGCRYVAIPWLDEDRRPGQPGYDRMLEGLLSVARVCREKGMTLLYHNHDFEFVRIDGEYALDRLYATVPADLLQTELDTCWVNVAGESPVEYLHKYAGRSPVVHLKDFVMPGKKPAHLYELIGVEEEDAGEQGGAFEFRPVGYGAQDFPAILEAAARGGASWVVVEQDQPSMGKTPMECARMSIRYLDSLK